MFGRHRSLTSTYGVIYTPDALWSVNVGFEAGDSVDPTGPDLTRTAVSAAITYNDEDAVSWRLHGEMRFENSANPANDRNTYLASANIMYRQSEDWRLITGIGAAFRYQPDQRTQW